VHRTALEKYIYFLLAAAGAAIGFALNQTHDAVFSWSKLPLAAAVLCWGMSFFFGCRQLVETMGMAREEVQIIKLKAGELRDFPPAPELVDAILKQFDAKIKRSSRFAKLQFGFLIAGAILYIAWHVTEMSLRTLST
jgi:hypothetical protein